MATIDYIRLLFEHGFIEGDYRNYRYLEGKTKYKVKGK